MVRVSSRRWRWPLALALALALALGPVLTIPAAPVTEGKTPKTATTPAEKIRKDLDRPLTVEFAEQPLPLALNQLRDQTKVNIVLDQFALTQMSIDPMQLPVSNTFKDAKLRTVLRTILTAHNLSFAIVGDYIFVSTDEICMSRQMRQRVSVDIEKGDLSGTLRKLARETGTNLLIDPKVTREAATLVTLQLDDVPLETAARLMTEMVGLKVVRVGNVLFVCSKAQAVEMRQDPDFMPGGPGAPGMDVPVPVPGPGPIPRGGIGGFVPPGAIPNLPGNPNIAPPVEDKPKPVDPPKE